MINHWEVFRRDGYCTLPECFTQKQMRDLIEAFDDIVMTRLEGVGIIPETDGTTIRSIMGGHRHPRVDEWERHPIMSGFLSQLLGPDYERLQTKYNPKAGMQDGVALGKKWDPHRGDTYWVWKDGVMGPQEEEDLAPEGMVTMLVAVTDQTLDNGPLWAWKGTHQLKLSEVRPHMTGLESLRGGTERDTAAELSLQFTPKFLAYLDDNFEKVPLVGPTGTVWPMHSSTIHVSSDNLSPDTRILVANVYRRADHWARHPRPEPYFSEPRGSRVLI